MAWYRHASVPNLKGFDKTNSEMERVRREVMVPSEAVERVEAAVSRRDNFLDPIDCIDEVCPYVQRSWFVPVATGTERQFLDVLTNRLGYKITYESLSSDCVPTFVYPCHIEATRADLHLLASSRSLGSIKPPARDVAPKQWQYVVIRIEKR
ncbi:hypothetical protein Rhe02_47240 [Rhizocola hellebori]|uniref:Uncharacterized protein n=1 Tax=Rhizocola hellebori TaxID=1392758 RepID=A0A8J3VHV1_9ACTN|nr:hypothetical protein Rhe02_47240 [Rhizocola hellebori]